MALIKTASSDNLINLNNSLDEQLIFDDINKYKFDYSVKLGEGRFGKVRLATHKLTKEKVAIKVIDKNQIKLKEERQRIDNEISILKELHHYNIAKLYSTIENEERIYLVQEYVKGNDLNYFIKTKEKPEIKEQNTCKYFRQIISAVEYIHKLGIAHRDLKPENILINKNNDIKLIDFGLSKHFSKGELLKTPCGSPFYASPEMVKGNKYNGISSDIWSLGIILYLMLFQELPFMDADVNRLYKKILEGKYEIPKDKKTTVSKDAIDLIKKILEVNPKNRIKISGIIKHKWFNKVKTELNYGLNIKEIILPIDEQIVEEMKNSYGFDKMRIRNTILKNLYNNIRTIYLILLEKKIKDDKSSVSDLHSNLYKDYINDEKNKLIHYNNDIKYALKERINSKEKLIDLIDYEENKELKDANNNENILNFEDIGSHKNNFVRATKKKSLTIIDKNINFQPNLLFNLKKKKLETIIKKEIENDCSEQKIKRLSTQNIRNRGNLLDNSNRNEIENENKFNAIKIQKNSNYKRFNSNKVKKFPELKAILNKKNLKNSSSNSRTEKKLNSKFNRNNNNLNKMDKNLSLSYDKTESFINKYSKEIIYEKQKDNVKNLFNSNKNDSKNKNSSKSKKNLKDINKNIKTDSLVSNNKSNEKSKKGKKLLSNNNNNKINDKNKNDDTHKNKNIIKNNSIMNKKLSLKLENVNNEKIKIGMKPGKTVSNFKPIKNNNHQSRKKIDRKDLNKAKDEIIKVKENILNGEKNKNSSFISHKTNYNLINKKLKIKTNSAEKKKDSFISNRIINIKKNITNNNYINRSISNTCNNKIKKSTSNNEKSLDSFVRNNDSEMKKKNALDMKIMVNLVKNENKKHDIKKLKTSSILNCNKKIENNPTESKNLLNEDIIFGKKINNFESPFDLSSLFIFKKDQNLKPIIEKYFKKNKIVFNSLKEKKNININKINYSCNKKGQVKFNINIVKIKNDHINEKEHNDFYICRIKNLSLIKYDSINMLNSLLKALINK